MISGDIFWRGYRWFPRETWGLFHHEKLSVYYDEGCVKINNFELELITKYSPKYFKEVDTTIPYAVGLVTCDHKFEYGTFYADIKFPKGRHLQPAFWLYPWDTSKPEIDIMEGYSKENNYFKFSWAFWKFWHIESNFHLGPTDKDNTSLGAKRYFVGFVNPSNKFNRFSLFWTPDEITIRINGKTVRKIKDEKILSLYRGKQMRVIINNTVTEEKLDSAISYMTVKNFSYTPLKF